VQGLRDPDGEQDADGDIDEVEPDGGVEVHDGVLG
jgi:hypothetical protein